jgi:eukaryotic-like serine/threonine-protein kinase
VPAVADPAGDPVAPEAAAAPSGSAESSPPPAADAARSLSGRPGGATPQSSGDRGPVRDRSGRATSVRERTAPEEVDRTGPVPAQRNRRGRAVAVVSMVALLGAAAIVLTVILHHPSKRAHLTGTPSKSTGGTTAPARTPSTRASSSLGSPTPDKSDGPSATPGGGTLPADFRRYEDDSGFSIGVPRGWKVSHEDGYVYVRDPRSSRYLLIDQTTHPKSDPLADWRDQDAYRRENDSGYSRIRLESVPDYFKKAADLEFLHSGGGGKTRVLNRNILVNDHRAYALYWSTPAGQWAGSRRYFDVFAASFRPAS